MLQELVGDHEATSRVVLRQEARQIRQITSIHCQKSCVLDRNLNSTYLTLPVRALPIDFLSSSDPNMRGYDLTVSGLWGNARKSTGNIYIESERCGAQK